MSAHLMRKSERDSPLVQRACRAWWDWTSPHPTCGSECPEPLASRLEWWKGDHVGRVGRWLRRARR